MRIPGTRFGVALFCTPNHNYKIFVYQTIIGGVRIFYSFDYKNNGSEIILNNYWELKGPNYSRWVYTEDKHIIKKNAIRDGVFVKWE